MDTTKEKAQMNFEEDTLEFIEDKIESNLEKLFHHKKYSEASETFSQLNLQLLSTLDEKQRHLFRAYQNTALTLNSYQNVLAYYLGFHEPKK